jgi:hypothetical protein
MDSSIPNELLELKARFDQWRANRNYKNEPMPDQLRDAVLEQSNHYPRSLLRQVLKIDPWRLMPKTKTTARRSGGKAQTAFFKLPPVTQAPLESLPTQTSATYRLQLERPDGSRLTLILPSFDSAVLNALWDDFLRGASR